MAKLRVLLILIFIIISILCTLTTVEPSSHSHGRSRTQAYIEISCRATQYPDLCVRCLSDYVKAGLNGTLPSPKELAQYALAVSLSRAQSTRTYLLKVGKELKAMKAKEYQAVKDCLEQIDLSVDELSMSIKELRRLGHKTTSLPGNDDNCGDTDMFWHISNVETWVGSALTDASSCVDEFPGWRMSKLKATIKGKVLNVAQVTANALALFHRFASSYRAAGPTHKP